MKYADARSFVQTNRDELILLAGCPFANKTPLALQPVARIPHTGKINTRTMCGAKLLKCGDGFNILDFPYSEPAGLSVCC